MIIFVLAFITALELMQSPRTYIITPEPAEPIEYVVGFLDLARGGFVCQGSICVEWHNHGPVLT